MLRWLQIPGSGCLECRDPIFNIGIATAKVTLCRGERLQCLEVSKCTWVLWMGAELGIEPARTPGIPIG